MKKLAFISLLITPLLFLLLFLYPVADCQAKDLYVDIATGNDSTTYAQNDVNNKWRTLGRATWGSTNRNSPNSSEAAQAGDTVHVASGIYDTLFSGGERYDPAYNPVNSGSLGNYITFLAESGVEVRSTTETGPVIGALNRNYIIWDGFIVDEAYIRTQPDTGPVVVWNSDNVTIRRCDIRGAGALWGDNHKGISIMNGSDYTTISNNRIHGFYTHTVNAHNGAGIQIYNSYNWIIENNEIYDSGSGIFTKELIYSPAGTGYIRYNYIHDIQFSGIALHRLAVGTGVRVYNNLITNSGSAVRYWGFEAGQPSDVIVANNSIINCTNGVFLSSADGYVGNYFWNNIIYNSRNKAIQAEDITPQSILYDLNKISFQHNVYWNNSSFAAVSYQDRSFNEWSTTFGQDSVAPPSLQTSPLFNNASGGDYTLAPSSPAIGRGVDILDLDNDGQVTDAVTVGAYITGAERIGRIASSEVPSPPQGLSVIRIDP